MNWLITEGPPYSHWKKGLNFLDVIDSVSQYGPNIIKVTVPESLVIRYEEYSGDFLKVFISNKWVMKWNASRNNPSSKYYYSSEVCLRLLNKEPHYEEVPSIPPTSLP